MKYSYKLFLAFTLALSSTQAFSLTTDDKEDISKSLIKCHNVLFALAVFGKLPISHEENELVERIRTAIPRITSKDDTLRLLKLVEPESQQLIAEITSENITATRVQQLKNNFTGSCTPVLLSAESLHDAP